MEFKDSLMVLNFYDTPGLDISKAKEVVKLSKYKEKEFHLIVIDLSKI